MQTALVAVVLIVVPVALWSALISMPRWCVRTLYRHRMWRLRDAIVDAMIERRLPTDAPCVDQLLRVTTSVALHGSRVSAVGMFIERWALKANPEIADTFKQRADADHSTAGLTREQAELIDLYRYKFAMLVTGMLYLGSWFGFFRSIRFLVPALVHEYRNRGTETTTQRNDVATVTAGNVAKATITPQDNAWGVVTHAADTVVESAPFTREFANRTTQLIEREAALAPA